MRIPIMHQVWGVEFTRWENPYMKIMDSNDARHLEQGLFDLLRLDVSRNAFHQDRQGILDQMVSGVEHQKREDEGANRINNRQFRVHQ